VKRFSAAPRPVVDPLRSNAVLVGVGAYTDLATRPAARAGAEDLAAILTDPDRGGQDKRRCVLLGEDTYSREVGDKLAEAAAAAEDMLLFYFAGHGLLGPNGELYLALGTTTARRPGMTGGLRYHEVREIFRFDSRAENKIVILDCCYSGTVLAEGLSDAEGAVGAGTAIDGTAVLTAVPGNAMAMIPQGEAYPAVTGRLIRLLRDDEAHNPPALKWQGTR
jgi:caspase domain-containing protein